MHVECTRVILASVNNHGLAAYCVLELDGIFVVHNVRVIHGSNGLLVCMPSKKKTRPCARCGWKNPLQARFCSECGVELHATDLPRPAEMHLDVAHPSTSEFRREIDRVVLEAYHAEQRRQAVS